MHIVAHLTGRKSDVSDKRDPLKKYILLLYFNIDCAVKYKYWS